VNAGETENQGDAEGISAGRRKQRAEGVNGSKWRGRKSKKKKNSPQKVLAWKGGVGGRTNARVGIKGSIKRVKASRRCGWKTVPPEQGVPVKSRQEKGKI